MKNFKALKLKDFLCLFMVFVLGFFWIHMGVHNISDPLMKVMAIFVVLVFLFYMQFVLNKPDKIYLYSNSIALISFLFVAIVSFVLHVIINHHFNFELILIWIIAGVLPYVSAFVYQLTRKI